MEARKSQEPMPPTWDVQRLGEQDKHGVPIEAVTAWIRVYIERTAFGYDDGSARVEVDGAEFVPPAIAEALGAVLSERFEVVDVLNPLPRREPTPKPLNTQYDQPGLPINTEHDQVA